MNHTNAIANTTAFSASTFSPSSMPMSRAASSTNSRSILVIDDDADIRDLIEGYFRPRKFGMHFYEDAEKALADLSRNPQLADVILTDFSLPNLNGIEFTQRMRAMGLNIPIILITAQQAAEVAVQAIEAGAYDFIVKPLHFAQLLVSVERALHFASINHENAVLKAVVRGKDDPSLGGVIGKSEGFRKALDLAARVAKSAANVLINGESGSGKEIIARSIHRFGNRSKGPFIAINCSAIPENLLESELFGYAKGAFTGASDKKIGLFEEACGGTLFLDEIGDLPLSLQAKLLRVLQDRKIKRLGENQEREIDVRIVSATHKDLVSEVSAKNFREDLFFRLNVIPILIPPLRERKEDIIPLAHFFLSKFSALNNTKLTGFSKEAFEKMLIYPWRGNVRELENKIERAVVLCSNDTIGVDDLFDAEPKTAAVLLPTSLPLDPEGRLMTLESLTTAYIQFALKKNGFAKDRTAKDLGIDRKTLYKRLRDLKSDGAPQEAATLF